MLKTFTDGFTVDINDLINKVHEMMRKLEVRTRTFLDLRKHLDQNGIDIEDAVQLIKNSSVETLKSRKQRGAVPEKKTQDLLKWGGTVTIDETTAGGKDRGKGLDYDDLVAICRA